MPNFNLPQGIDFDALQPTYPDEAAGAAGAKPQQVAPPKRRPNRAQMERGLEAAAGPLKPLAQLMNTLASPDAKAGLVVGPVNAVSKLTNALGDLVQRKPIDTRDAWQVPDKAVRQLNPFRLQVNVGQAPGKGLIYLDDGEAASDKAGLAVGGAIGAEALGAAVGLPVIKGLARVAQLKRVADAARAAKAVKGFAVAQRFSGPARTAVQVGKNVGEALGATIAATPFLDVSQGNTANLGDMFGQKLPGRVEKTDNYLEAFGKTVLVDGLAAPLAVMGALSFLPAARRAMFGGEGAQWLDDLADQELAPYRRSRPQLPPADPPTGAPAQLPSVQMQAAADGSPISPVTVREAPPRQTLGVGGADQPRLPPPGGTSGGGGGALLPQELNGSAIERFFDEATQIRQVEEQRQRLLDAGLLRQGQDGQLELGFPNEVDPAVEQQIRQLQGERGQLLREMSARPDAADEITKQLDEIDTEIADLTMNGTTAELATPRVPFRQSELNLDTRPELDTALAQLDELSDKQLRDLHSRVFRKVGAERNAQELAATQQQVQQLTQRLAEIDARRQAGEITARGAKGLLTRTQRDLRAAQVQLQSIEQRVRVPETTVGEQLGLAMEWQTGLDLSPGVELPPLRELTGTAEDFGYRTPDDYRVALQGWGRDELRRLAMPSVSPEVAAIVKARTGRRVWAAKKADIVDALVELSQRQGRYLPPDPEQLGLGLQNNLANLPDTPLLDVPADLSAPPPVNELRPRGMDATTRERLKTDVLRRMIDNGEVQAPSTPIPSRPSGPQAFNQGSFLDDLLADDTGQLALQFVNDQLPPYKAGGKNADALIDEMRLRFEFNILDAQAQQAQKDTLREAIGWDRLSWDEKKRLGYELGLMGRGMFALRRSDLPAAVDQVRPPTPQFSPNTPVGGERAPQPYRNEGSVAGQTPQFTPELQPKPERKPALYDTAEVYASINGGPAVVPRDVVANPSAPAAPPPKGGKAPPAAQAKPKGKAARTPAQQEAAQRIAARDAERAQIRKDIEDLRNKFNGGSCS